MQAERNEHELGENSALVENLRKTLETSVLSLEARIALNRRLYSLTRHDQFRIDADNLEIFTHLRGSLPPIESED